MNKTLKLIPLLLLLVMSSMASCKSEPKYHIGVSQCSQDDWRSKLNDEIVRESLLHNDIEIEIRSADDSDEKQIADLRYFADNDFDIIICAPNGSEALTPIIDSIYQAGIPVILFDRRIDSDNYTVYCGTDNRAIGIAAAEYINSIDEHAHVIEIQGNLGSTPAIERHQGFLDYVAGSSLNLLGSGEASDWSYEGGERQADSLLSLYPETSVIYAHNDRIAIGASHAATKKGREDIKIIGIDATPTVGIPAVVDSVIYATFIYPTDGRELIQMAKNILGGKTYDKDLYQHTVVAVDRSNAKILLLQNEALKVETRNIAELKTKLDVYQQEHTNQQRILLGVATILILSFVIIFLLLRSFWVGKNHRISIEQQNQQLIRQRDEIEQQNRQLKEQHDEINDILHKLKQATQSKLTFFTNVSHDLKTPLTLIAEPVEQLVNANNLTSRQTQLMRLASKNVKILMRLINQILDFRKYEDNQLNIHLVEVNLATKISDWTEAFKALALKKHIKFKVDISEDCGDYNMAIDVDKIESVLFNLLSNAFKFTPANGEVVVTLLKERTAVKLIVSDTGKGISKDNITRIFERFFKVEELNSQGSGIGLALTKAFVELHDGHIDVTSEEGSGTTFTVSLPVRHVEQKGNEDCQPLTAANVTTELADIEEETPETLSVGDKIILVIDDNADICTLIKTLTQDKFIVMQASNGTQGIKLATKYIPDVIICDIMMPGIDGLETCRRLKQEVITSHIPVLMLTACTMDEQRIAGYSCGADAYLTKPFSATLLVARINALIENRKLLLGTTPDVPSAREKITANPHSSNIKDIDSEFLNRFANIVEQKLSDSNLAVDEIASDMGVSRVQLYRKIKSLTNYSPTDLLRIYRLKKAATMLKTTETTVAEVCYAVGFTSHSYFSKCYKEYFGESPSDAQHRTSKPK